MRKVYVSTYDRNTVIILPVPPKVSYAIAGNNSIFIISDGELNLPGFKGLKQITLTGFFPGKEYSFSQSKTYSANELVEFFEGYQTRREPFRLVIPKDDLNLPVIIDRFEYEKIPNGDINFTLGVSEFRVPGV